MKLPYKITLIALGLVVLLTALMGFAEDSNLRSYMVIYGFIAAIAGLAAVAGIFTAIFSHHNKDWMNGFFLTAGILLLTGFFGLTQITFSR